MRWGVVIVGVVVGCKGSAPNTGGAGSATGSGSGATVVAALDAALAPQDAKPAWVELLRAVPTKLRVSSLVANKTIKPGHLVDRDLGTAWNSVTGELTGAWIDIELPPTVAIGELRMTVGHTGKGPKGEDYFAMNHRITKASVLRDDQVLATFTFDPARRDLQPMPLATGGGTLRIRIDQVEAGTKPSWREVAVSELEVWGDPPPGFTPPPAPLQPNVEVQPPAPVASLKDACKDESADCRIEIMDAKLAPPWQGVGVRCLPAEHYGSICTVVVAVANELVEAEGIYVGGPHDEGSSVSIDEAYVKDVIPPRPPELVLRYSGGGAWLTVFRSTPDVRHSRPIQVGGSIMEEPSPDQGGPPMPTGEHWSLDVRFDGGAVVLRDPLGNAPSEVLGKKPLEF